MTCYHMSRLHLTKCRGFLSAAFLTPRTAVMEATAPDRSGLYSGIRNDLIQSFDSRVRNRYRGDQHFCIRMQRIGIELICICDLHEISKIKHPDLITDLLDHLQLMADEQIGQPVFFLKILKHLNDLGLQGNIQRRNGLIADYKFRLYGKCSCNGNPLTLSAGELMRILQKILAL